ncbi:MAG: chromate transporter [Deltaproteobacteria bacterium]|nr:chromate transporter [Deltaproteobacteria bacterium]
MTRATHTEWIWLNFKIGTFSIGVASRLQLFEEAIVRKHKWLSADEFQELLTLAQMLPGPNLVNFAMCAGSLLVGRLAAILAVVALILPGAILAIAVYSIAPLHDLRVKIWFQGMAIGAFLLTARFIWQLAIGLRLTLNDQGKPATGASRKWWGRALIAASVTVASFYGLPVVIVVLVAAAVCLLWEFSW